MSHLSPLVPLLFYPAAVFAIACGCIFWINYSSKKLKRQQAAAESLEVLKSLTVSETSIEIEPLVREEIECSEIDTICENYINRWENFNPLALYNESSPVPDHFLIASNGNAADAALKWTKALEWRKNNDINQILREKQPHFDAIKSFSPHFWHGKDKFGRPVYYDLLGKINTKEGTKDGMTVDQYIRHCLFCSEFLWNIIDADIDQQMIAIMDVKGIGFQSLTGFALDVFKSQSEINSSYYPNRCFKAFIVNAPSWFSLLYPILTRALDSKTKERMTVLSTDFSELYNYIDKTQIPPQYGGSSVELGHSAEEKAIKEIVKRNNSSVQVFHAPPQ